MPNETDYALNGKLISAVEGNDIEQVKRLIAEGADVNCKRGNVPLLIYAIFRSKWVSVNTLRCLLENGAKVDELDDISSTALSWAVYQARPEAVALLLEFNSEPRRLSKDGVSSLQVIEGYLSDYTGPASENPYRLSRLEIMIGYTDPAEAVAKWIECKELLTHRIEELEKEEAKLLKRERRSDSDSEGEQAARDAEQAARDAEQAARDAEQAARDAKLFNAIKKNLTPDARLERVKEELERGANVNAQHDNINNKNTPLHLAVKKEQEETVDVLLQRGANVQLKNNKGETPLDLAKDNPKILSLLATRKAQEDILQPDDSPLIPSELEHIALTLNLDTDYQSHWEKALAEDNTFKILALRSQKLSTAQAFIKSKLIKDNDFDKSNYLFLIVVRVKEQEEGLTEVFLKEFSSNIDQQRPLMTQWEFPSGNKIYIKPAQTTEFKLFDLNAASSFSDKEAFEAKISLEQADQTQKGHFDLSILLDGLKSGLGGHFKEQGSRRSLLGISFDKEAEFDELTLAGCAAQYSDDLSLHFLRLHQWNFAKRNEAGRRPLEIAAEQANEATLKALLDIPLSATANRFGFFVSEKTKVLLALKDLEENTPLFIAAKAGKEENVKLLIQSGSDLHYKKKVNENEYDVMDVAWEEKCYGCVRILLEADMAFPAVLSTLAKEEEEKKGKGEEKKGLAPTQKIESEIETIEDLKKWIAKRNQLHQLIQTGDVAGVKSIISSSTCGRYGLNAENQSVLVTALKAKQYEIYVELLSMRFSHHPEEEYYFNNLGMPEREALRPFLAAKFLEPEDSYLTSLSNKSQLGRDNTRDQFKFVNEFYWTLNKIPQLKAVMQVVATSETAKLCFDFNKACIEDLDPTSRSSDEMGLYNPKNGGRLYMGAKGANVEGESAMKGEVLGTLAHEMTHFAMQLRYKNDAKPYGAGDIEKKEWFEKIVQQVFKQALPQLSEKAKALLENPVILDSSDEVIILEQLQAKSKYTLGKNEKITQGIKDFIGLIKEKKLDSKQAALDDVIKRVFVNYPYDRWVPELIVRVPHLLAKERVSGVNQLQAQVPELWKYYEEKITPDFKIYIENPEPFKGSYHIGDLNKQLGSQAALEGSPIRLESVDLVSTLSKSGEFILLLETDSPALSRLNLYQDFEQNGLEDVTKSSIFTQIHDFNNQFLAEKILEACQSVAQPRLIISYSEPAEEQSLETVRETIKGIAKKRIILITTPMLRQKLVDALKLSDEALFTVEEDKAYRWKDLTVASQQALLEKKVIFQGETTVLNQLLDKETAALINTKMLEELVSNKEIIIGKQLSTLGEMDAYYIDRTFNYQVAIKPEIKNAKSFSDFWSETQEGFKKLCQEHPKKSVHWLKLEAEHLIWQQSQGSLSALREYIDPEYTQTYQNSDWLNSEKHSKVVIVSDTPGMGKSTVLTHVAQQIKQQYPDRWVVRLDSSNYAKLLDEAQKVGRLKKPTGVMQFLSQTALNLESASLAQVLFERCSQKEGKIIVMFDGIDEVSPERKDAVMGLVNTLKESAIEQFWISTRPHLREALEDTLQQFSYTLESFSENDKKTFLKKFWQTRNPMLRDTNKVESYAEKLIVQANQWISEKEKTFTGIPLQLRMLAEIFEKKQQKIQVPGILKEDFFIIEEGLEEFYTSGKEEAKFPEKLNLHNLYELFVYKKFCDVLEGEKYQAVFSNSLVQERIKRDYKILLESHRQLALYSVLGEEVIRNLLSEKEVNDFKAKVLASVKEGAERTGIVERVIQGKPHFIHPTFAEYFVADFFADQLATNNQNQKIQDFLLKEILLKPEYKVIRAFLNSNIEGNPLAKNILEFCGNKIEELWRQSKVENSWRGENGKTIFHVAASEDNFSVISFLFDSLKSAEKLEDLKEIIQAKDYFGKSALYNVAEGRNADLLKKLFNFIKANLDVDSDLVIRKLTAELFEADLWDLTIFCRSVESGKAEMVKVLLDLVKENLGEGADVILEEIFQTADRWGLTPLHKAVKNGYLDSVKYLVEAGAPVAIKDEYGNEPLHFAVLTNRVLIVKYLLENGANVNAVDKEGKTLLELAFIINVVQVNVDIVEFLIENGADVLKKNNHDSVLHQAIHTNEKIVKLMLEKIKEKVGGGDPRAWYEAINAKDSEGDVPLMWAVEKRKSEVVTVLLDYGVDINAQNNEGMTALHWSIRNPQLEIFKRLIQRGADVTVKDTQSRTPLDLINTLNPTQEQKALYQTMITLLESKLVQQKAELSANGNRSPLDCLPGPSTRQKRNAADKGCEISWEDVDEFNAEKEKPRDFDKIKINSEQFIDYLQSKQHSEVKAAQLINLADSVVVTGKSTHHLSELINKKKYYNIYIG
ncbi:ankyrin repeat domain-containing protein [Rickettsiella endosymbiont of Dermanyssus gallinae]|uniref:ankyrin repeat domain-containing protein n=1 Tax=Rickettsiella endosymbiont of Dermanyssus gallinae TaxID=2856608 RepID=UPI001C531920|nr:ankyrin repeat domain-containing protein [Rickettsiella endosymbiont of Dermanyssus gallinae]